MTFAQAQMHADRMHFGAVTGQAQDAMEQATVLIAADRYVEVVVANDLEFRQQRVAVIALRVHRVAPIGELRPEAVGEEFVLRHRRPIVVALGVLFVGAMDFLQKHHVGGDAAHRFAQLRQDETPVEGGETLVGIDRQHGERAYRWRDYRTFVCKTDRFWNTHANTPSPAGSPGVVTRSLSSSKRCSRSRAS